MANISKHEDIADFRLADIPGLILLWVLMVVVFMQFFTRYILNDSLGWTEEAARFLLILVGFVGSVLAVRKNSHIALEFFYRFVPEVVGKAMRPLADLVTFIFYLYLSYVGVKLAQITGQNMVSIPVPKNLIYWAVVVALLAMAFYAGRQFMAHLRIGNKLD